MLVFNEVLVLLQSFFLFFLIARLFSVQPRTELCCNLRSLERGLTVLPNSAVARKFARCRVSVARCGTIFFFFFGMHVLSGVSALAEGRKGFSFCSCGCVPLHFFFIVNATVRFGGVARIAFEVFSLMLC